ncbi:double-strand break repair protein AddB [Sphingomonas sp. 28-63-12]|uniref:double-strand break repair protein AddB n=1 Tax=Sphingomonas sp. 28-63-12 TaxID=1970434 RepID=UPI000BC7E827|nr:MAG: double-strand break repair protein AddB [Sphingomonas sp. 28-63-12]
MPDRAGPQLFSIPAHRAFADALAAGLIRRFGKDKLALARGIVLLPNNRAKRTITDAFVRASGGGLLLPRLVAIGDADGSEAADVAIDPAGDADPVPPAIAPLARQMILARLVSEERARAGTPIDAAEAVRLAGELARTLDQMLVEEVAPARLRHLEIAEELSDHWQRALAMFGVVLDRWPRELARLGRIDLADRRARLLHRLGARWSELPPPGFVCAAGITTAAPAIARLLRVVSEMPQGLVVFPGLATEMDEAEWQALGPHAPDPATGARRRSIETHPQFQLKLLLDRMGVNRGEVVTWREGGGHDASAGRGRAIANALAPADYTGKWTMLPADERRLGDVSAAILATPAEEAQAIALALREALETSDKTAALVTPDRALARRVAAHCARWGVAIDDSAGRPLSILPSGTMLTVLAEAAAQQFAPLALLALLKHPLVRFGDQRLAWLEGVRRLDLALRGPRPAPGLDGIAAYLAEGDRRAQIIRRPAAAWWPQAQAVLEPIAALFAAGPQPLDRLIAGVRETAQALCGDALWSGVAGRAAAELLAAIEAEATAGPALIEPHSLAPLLRTLMEDMAVRPPQGGHPRLAIYGLIEARLQTADLMILGGLNEGVWPGQPAPDPWLAPRIRIELGLPALDRRVGLAAHDLAAALGAPEVLLTRARRDARSPAIASRFWLRLEAMSGGLVRAAALEQWARTIDRPDRHAPADRPAPMVPIELRPKRISVTEVDRLKADPFAFYARRVLGLGPLDPVDADPSAAWRGTAVHAILEAWAKDDNCAPEKLRDRAQAMLNDARTHPMMRALWQPRLIEAIDWIAREMDKQVDQGRQVLAAERTGEIVIAGVTLRGTADRIDRSASGGLAIIDYKTGKAPSAAAVRAGYSLQLGLLGLIAERGGFADIAGIADGFEYWSLAKAGDSFGKITSPVDPAGKRDLIPTADFTTLAAHNFIAAAENWLTGDAPFTAKLAPDFAPYADYDQLMRRDEWYGRDQG